LDIEEGFIFHFHISRGVLGLYLIDGRDSVFVDKIYVKTGAKKQDRLIPMSQILFKSAYFGLMVLKGK
jgi:hypothetical protein